MVEYNNVVFLVLCLVIVLMLFIFLSYLNISFVKYYENVGGVLYIELDFVVNV